MRRLFLDANVLFTAAHNPQGKAAFLIELGRSGLIQVCSSSYAREEARRNLALKFPQCLERFDRMLEAVRLIPEPAAPLPCPDCLPEKDRPIWRAALACRADALLTGDLRDFGPLMGDPTLREGPQVQTVAEFLDSL